MHNAGAENVVGEERDALAERIGPAVQCDDTAENISQC